MRYVFKGDDIVGSFVNHQLEELGFEQATSFDEADAIVAHCYHAGALEDLYFDDNGLIKEAKPGTLIVNLSPSTPDLAREIAAVASVNDLRSVEAPLAFMDAFAHHALFDPSDLVCYLGGEVEDCEAVRELAGALASKVIEAGDVGSAQLAKVLHTIHQASHIVAAVEEHALYYALHEKRLASEQREFPFGEEDKFFADLSERIQNKNYDDCYSATFLMSDIVAAMASADDAELILPQLEAALHILELFGVIGGADKGVSALALLYRDEKEGAEAGLDWTRAEGFYGEQGSGPDQIYEDDEFDFGDNIDFFSN